MNPGPKLNHQIKSFNKSAPWHVEAFIGDTIKFLCPPSKNELTLIRRVDKATAQRCIVLDSLETLVGTCLQPHDSVIERLRSNQILPNKHTYEAEKTYYFITTSTGQKDGINNTVGGLCQQRGMKLEVYVKPKNYSSESLVKKDAYIDTKREEIPITYPEENIFPKVILQNHSTKRVANGGLSKSRGVDYEIDYVDTRKEKNHAKTSAYLGTFTFWILLLLFSELL